MTVNFKEKSFLIVDDQRAFQLMLKALLVNLGVRDISLASSGEAAVSKSRKRAFDFVLIDYNLGNRKKNGRQLLEELKIRQLVSAATVTIIITGESHRPMVLGAIELQPDDYLMKPFSLNVLQQRMVRAFIKRNTLLPLHQLILKAEYAAAIPVCLGLIDANPRYQNYCLNMLAQLYYNTQQYPQAEKLLKASLKQQNSSWAQVQLARVYSALNKHQEAIQVAQSVIKISPLVIDSYDIMTEALVQINEPARALEMAIKACELSPYSVERQQTLVNIAQQNGLYELACETNRFILEMCRNSVQQDPQHSFNYIRSVINAAEQASDKHEQNKYMQEASLALQRAKHEESSDETLFSRFEKLSRIRIEAIRHPNIAKQNIYHFLAENETQDIENVEQFVFEQVTIMNRLGEYEPAEMILKQHQNSAHFKKQGAEKNLRAYNSQFNEQKAAFHQQNSAGIKAYNEQDHSTAIIHFENALLIAPGNTGCTLNLMLALLKQASLREKMASDVKNKLANLFKLLHKVELASKQKKRYKDLYLEFSKWLNLSS